MITIYLNVRTVKKCHLKSLVSECKWHNLTYFRLWNLMVPAGTLLDREIQQKEIFKFSWTTENFGQGSVLSPTKWLSLKMEGNFLFFLFVCFIANTSKNKIMKFLGSNLPRLTRIGLKMALLEMVTCNGLKNRVFYKFYSSVLVFLFRFRILYVFPYLYKIIIIFYLDIIIKSNCKHHKWEKWDH